MGAASAMSLASCIGDAASIASGKDSEDEAGEMTYRVNPKTGEKVSLLGYGCMRYLTQGGDPNAPIDQDEVNRSIDYALAHGVNYFDTSPAYCKGESEKATGIALSRHPRDSYYIATKLSNFAPETWSRERSIAMYRNSLEQLRTPYLDYMLLHAIGGGDDSMATLNARYFDNGILDFLAQEREAGRIRNLGFSFHGDIRVYDHMLSLHDKYKWDFVQIQLNYVDWNRTAQTPEQRNVDARYLYDELKKRAIPAVIMEPLLGGQLAKLNDHSAATLKALRPDDSLASWAFRFAGTPDGILTVLSGMTYMEHLQDNVRTYSPLEPITEDEDKTLRDIAIDYMSHPLVPCTACQYCMPCPYGLDIPSIFAHYNKCVNEGNVPEDSRAPGYDRARKAFLLGYDRSVPRLRQANHCVQCGRCAPHCPQKIDIPARLADIDTYVEKLKRDTPAT